MSGRCRSACLGIALVAFLGLDTTLAATAAHAGEHPSALPSVDVTPSEVARCESTRVTGAEWEPDTEVSISLDGAQGDVLVIAVVNSDGTFAADPQISCDTSVGLHSLGIFGVEAGGDLEALEIPISVVASAAGTAATGSDVTLGLGAMLTLLALGIVTVVAARGLGARAIPRSSADV